VKTAISVPDEVFDAATKRARELGISRSEFFSTAARRYLDDLARSSLTDRINEVLDLPGYHDEASELAASLNRRLLSADDAW
jgi:hypothetical protein